MAVFRRGVHLGTYTVGGDPGRLFDRVAEAARVAEEAGFDAVSVPDHLQQNAVGGGPGAPMFEAYTMLGALATVTRSVRLLALVSPVTLRPPALLAKAVTSVDVVSGGRAVLGLGAGWDEAEHAAYGLDFPPLGERMDRLGETLAVCRALIDHERATVAGTYYRLADAPNVPRPLGPMPVLVAGGGERRTLALAARYGDACNVVGEDPAAVRHKLDVLDRHCEAIGRDPAEITRTVFLIGEESPSALADRAAALAEVGVEGVVVMVTYDLDRLAATGQALAEALPSAPG